MERNLIISELNSFYKEEGIQPDGSFDCKKNEKCLKEGITLAQGMQCHIGTKYGEKTNVLVVSLDCGKGGAQTIKDRTAEIEGLISEDKINPHMRGTINCLSDFYQMFDNEKKKSVSYFAMINACKCTRKDSAEQLPDYYYEKCYPLKLKEIEIINPDVIYFQGRRALIGCEFEEVIDPAYNGSKALKFFILRIDNEEKKIYAVQCIHPSARGRHSKKKKAFYQNELPVINSYLRDKLNSIG